MSSRITALNIYPVKSCAGISLQQSRLYTTGLEYDRQWVIVDRDGCFVTQREYPQMACIGTAINKDALTLSAPGLTPLHIPTAPHGPSLEVTVWNFTGPALDQGDAAAQWLTQAIGQPVRLARFDPAIKHLCNPEFAGDTGAHTLFSDGYPLLVISEASLADLNRRMRTPLPMNRFRPNVVISGVEAFEEDYIDTLATDKSVLKLVKPCVRCSITTTDQQSGIAGTEPLHTLATFRMNETLGGLTFGQNAIALTEEGATLAVGQALGIQLNF